MRSSLVISPLSYSALVLSRSTAVRKTGHGPTGYVVDFVFHGNSTSKPSSVLLGGIPLFSDALNASPSRTSGFLPYNWKPDQFPLALFPTGDVNQDTYAGFNMTWNQATNDWEITLPLPSGTYQYAFYPDCYNITSNCAGIVDANNPPLAPSNDDQMFSTVQVPFNRRYQSKDYDYQLPFQNTEARGSVQYFDYPSPGSTYPSCSQPHRLHTFAPPELIVEQMFIRPECTYPPATRRNPTRRIRSYTFTTEAEETIPTGSILRELTTSWTILLQAAISNPRWS